MFVIANSSKVLGFFFFNLSTLISTSRVSFSFRCSQQVAEIWNCNRYIHWLDTSIGCSYLGEVHKVNSRILYSLRSFTTVSELGLFLMHNWFSGWSKRRWSIYLSNLHHIEYRQSEKAMHILKRVPQERILNSLLK